MTRISIPQRRAACEPPTRWLPGTPVLWRFLRAGQVLDARPVTVVRDSPDHLAVWLAEHTPLMRTTLPDGSDIRSLPLELRFRHGRASARSVWRGPGILKVLPWGRAHSVWVFRTPEGRLAGWYVNLEAPHRRWHGGIDTADHVLDLWVSPDRSWRWKDEDEFHAAVEAGLFTPAQAAEIRAEGERVVAAVEAWAPPFCDGWEEVLPDPAWPVPELPAHWAELP